MFRLMGNIDKAWLRTARGKMPVKKKLAKARGAETTKKPPKKSKHVKSKNVKQDICFTIMPFSDWFQDYYEHIYVPAIEAADLKSCRADDLYRPGTIVQDIWDYTKSAKLVLADLTGRNPNVFYELGLAHALAKPVILLSETIDEVPFDLRALRVIEYNKNESAWGAILKEKITKAIKEVLIAPQKAVLPSFIDTPKAGRGITMSPHEREIVEIRQDMEILKRALRDAPRPTLRGPELRPEAILNPEEAEESIRRYIKIGIPLQSIIRRLTSRGVPQNFTLSKYREIRRNNKK